MFGWGHRHRPSSLIGARLRPRVLLRAQGRGPGRHPEDLLPARPDGDRRPVRLRGWRDLWAPHLRSGDRLQDLRSYVAIHLSLILAVGVLITGSIWAKGSWGLWWTWDEPMLVSFLIVFLLYATYQPLRFSIEDPGAPGAVRQRLRGRRRRVRAAELRGGADGRVVPAPARARHHGRRDARRDEAHVPRRAARHGAAVRDAVEVRDGGEDDARSGSARCAASSPAMPRPSFTGRAAPQVTPDVRRRGLRRGGLPGLPRARADLRGDHGRAADADGARPRRAGTA